MSSGGWEAGGYSVDQRLTSDLALSFTSFLICYLLGE